MNKCIFSKNKRLSLTDKNKSLDICLIVNRSTNYPECKGTDQEKKRCPYWNKK